MSDQFGLSSKELKEIESVMSPVRLKVEKILKEDNTGIYIKYLSDFDDFKKITNFKKQQEKVIDMESKYFQFLRDSYKKAKINEDDYKKKIDSIIPRHKNYEYGNFLGIKSKRKASASTAPSLPACNEFVCPMDKKLKYRSGVFLNQLTGFSIGACSLTLRGFTSIAGIGEAILYLGKNAVIPNQKIRVVISATIDFELSGFALAAGGGSYSEADIGIYSKGLSIETAQYDPISSWAVAPVIWFMRYEAGESNYDLQPLQYTPDSSGGDYLAQVFSRIVISAGASASAVANCDITHIKKIKVCYE